MTLWLYDWVLNQPDNYQCGMPLGKKTSALPLQRQYIVPFEKPVILALTY